MKRILPLLALTAFALGCSSTPKSSDQPAPTKLPQTIEEAVASSNYRSEKDSARDQYRHPVETLEFFGLKPNMTVVEISPSSGWYLKILAPLLATNGHYIGAARPASNTNAEANSEQQSLKTWFDAHPEVAKTMTMTEFSPPEKVDIAPAGSADMVLTFRNVHNWMAKGAQKAAFAAFFKALKPGGVLGVTDHRANPKQKRDAKAKSGYVLEKDVIAVAKSVGFKFDKKSDINANPKDLKNYPAGVWTLPPTLVLKDKDREKYLAIGESDRLTLRFIKPTTSK